MKLNVYIAVSLGKHIYNDEGNVMKHHGISIQLVRIRNVNEFTDFECRLISPKEIYISKSNKSKDVVCVISVSPDNFHFALVMLANDEKLYKLKLI